MKLYAIHLFLILLFVLVLGCSFSNGIPFQKIFNSTSDKKNNLYLVILRGGKRREQEGEAREEGG